MNKKKMTDNFIPIGQIINKILLDLRERIIPKPERGKLYEIVDLYNARGLRIKGEKAAVYVEDDNEARIALGENFPLVVRNYGGTTNSKDGKFYPGCIFYVQSPEHARYLAKFMPGKKTTFLKDKKFPHHVTFRYRSWIDLIWLIQRFMREEYEK